MKFSPFHHQVGCHTKFLPALLETGQYHLQCSLHSHRKQETILVWINVSSLLSLLTLVSFSIPSLVFLKITLPAALLLFCMGTNTISFLEAATAWLKEKQKFPTCSPCQSLCVHSVHTVSAGLGQDCKAPVLGSWPPSDEQFPVEGYSLPVFRI